MKHEGGGARWASPPSSCSRSGTTTSARRRLRGRPRGFPAPEPFSRCMVDSWNALELRPFLRSDALPTRQLEWRRAVLRPQCETLDCRRYAGHRLPVRFAAFATIPREDFKSDRRRPPRRRPGAEDEGAAFTSRERHRNCAALETASAAGGCGDKRRRVADLTPSPPAAPLSSTRRAISFSCEPGGRRLSPQNGSESLMGSALPVLSSSSNSSSARPVSCCASWTRCTR